MPREAAAAPRAAAPVVAPVRHAPTPAPQTSAPPVVHPPPAVAGAAAPVTLPQPAPANHPVPATRSQPPTPALIPAAPPATPPQPAVAPRSHMRPRHYLLIVSFLLMVVLPSLVSAWYLWTKAADQYASTLGFSVHREEPPSALALINGLSSLTGTSSSSDTDIIYNYIYSQQVVAEIQSEIDLAAMWSRPMADPFFSYDPKGSIEDLVEYWEDMVAVAYDSATGLIEVRALAFAPEDAQRITTAIFEKSGAMINRLNQAAAEDAVRYTEADLEGMREKLVQARQEMTKFRNSYQMVDPSTDLASQSSILGSLEQELATTLISYDLIKGASAPDDPRLVQLERRRQVIEERIAAERAKIGLGSHGLGDRTMADVVAEYERLKVDLEFVETSYNAARAAHESAKAEALRQSRYLAPHILPTKAETSRFPEREKLQAIATLFLLLAWSVLALVYYSLRDRR